MVREGRLVARRSLQVMRVFNAFIERYDSWFDSPFGRSAFELEKSCIACPCRDLKRLALEIGVGTVTRMQKSLPLTVSIIGQLVPGGASRMASLLLSKRFFTSLISGEAIGSPTSSSPKTILKSPL